MAILRLIFTITNSSYLIKLFLHTYCRVCLHTWPAEMCRLQKRTMIRRIF